MSSSFDKNLDRIIQRITRHIETLEAANAALRSERDTLQSAWNSLCEFLRERGDI